MLQTVSELRARLESAVAVDAPARPDRMTITLLASMYLAHAQKEYNGQWSHKEHATIRYAFAPMTLLYGELNPDMLTPLQLRAVRQYWIDQQIARTTIQGRMQRLRKAWRWGRSVGLIEKDLPDIGHLRYGHAPEPEDVKPVDIGLVERTLPLVSPRARLMLKLMLLTGARPGEICSMKASEIDTTKQPWVYTPKHHKQSWRGIKREIFIGPRAQMLLQSHICGAGAAAMTSNVARVHLSGAMTAPSASPVANVFLTERGNPWRPNALYMAVFNACRKHGLPAWAPNQLRHTAATLLRERYGLDTAQAVLGHSQITTTQQYAERSSTLAAQAMLAVG